MILDIDAGNTRIKWRLMKDSRVPQTGISGIINTAADSDAWVAELSVLLADLAERAGRVRVSSVRKGGFNDRLSTLFLESWRIAPEFATVAKTRCGVTNAYENVQNMGVDRWLAMLAAWRRAGAACGILDFGSAITFDWLLGDGRHQGGYIVPGLNLMQDSLVKKTPALAVKPESGPAPVPGTNTATAIGNGVIAMAVGFAEHCHRLQGMDADTQWFLTGGDAGVISPHLGWPHTVVADLVLEGLALALP